MKLAIIDIGSNSIRLLLGEKNYGVWQNSRKELWTTRLGDRHEDGSLREASMSASFKAFAEINKKIQDFDTDKVLALATSAVREAPNGMDFLAEAKKYCNMETRILTGEEEAEYGFKGATRDYIEDGLHYCIIDVGGGSTELALGSKAGVYWSRSYKIGAVRLKEVSEEGPQRVWEETTNLWDPMPIAGPFGEFIGVGGTVTTLAAIFLGLEVYDEKKIQNVRLTREVIEGIIMNLRSMSFEERCTIPGLQAGRADIIVAGAEIITSFMDMYEVPSILVSEMDAMEGIQSEF